MGSENKSDNKQWINNAKVVFNHQNNSSLISHHGYAYNATFSFMKVFPFKSVFSWKNYIVSV